MRLKTNEMILCAIFSAVLCIFSVMTIPIGTIPITMGVFGVLITAVILGGKKGLVSTVIFILLGSVGLPVFSGMKGGLQVLAGPTGGYITGYVLMVLLVGWLGEKVTAGRWVLAVLQLCGICLLGVAVCYLFGTLQYMWISNKSFGQALALCVYPFIPLDILKSVGAAAIGYSVRIRLERWKT